MIPTSSVRLHDFRVASNDEEADSVFRLVMEAPALARTIEPGQFMNLNVPGDASHIVRLPLSFSRSDTRVGTVELVYAVVGEGTRRLSAMRPGDSSDVVGPCGHGWQTPTDARRCLLVSGGAGIAPIMAASRMLAERGVPFDVVIGAQDARRLWGVERARELDGGEVVVTTDNGSAGMRGLTTDAMGALLGRRAYGMAYACGPAPMMASVARLAAKAEIACQVSLERMMTCGFGACNTCNVAMVSGGYKACCTDGPVFDAREVLW